jgi:hypothetical protein
LRDIKALMFYRSRQILIPDEAVTRLPVHCPKTWSIEL